MPFDTTLSSGVHVGIAPSNPLSAFLPCPPADCFICVSVVVLDEEAANEEELITQGLLNDPDAGGSERVMAVGQVCRARDAR